jgi:glycosyltransferase involved in cell wall biosynthesis
MISRRLAVLEPIAHLGGGQISLLELVRKLNRDPQIILILPEDGPLRARALDAGAEVRILPWPARLMIAGERSGGRSPSNLARATIASTSIPGLARRLASLLNEIGADVLITNGVKSHILGAIAQLGSRRPLVWYLRDGLEGRVLSTLAMSALGRRCQGAIAISRYVEGEARKVLPHSLPMQVIYNLVDFARFHREAPPPLDLRKGCGEVWFGVVGSLTPLKGQDFFLRAAAEVAERLPQARFLLVGTNFYRTEATSAFEENLRRLAEKPSLAGRVTFLGQRDDVASILPMLDVVVQPNRGPEALGRSVLEAMASGVTVIAANKWGPAELIVDGETGVLTPVLDVPVLASNMLALGGQPRRRAALGAAAARWVRGELEPERIVKQFREFIEAHAV